MRIAVILLRMARMLLLRTLMPNPRNSLRVGPLGSVLRVGSIFCLLAIALAPGCGAGGDCVAAEHRCEGQTVESCEGDPGCGESLFADCTRSWHRGEVCGSHGFGSVVAPSPPACVVATPTLNGSPTYPVAFCALSADPDPNCKGKSGYCSAGAAVACREGFAVSSTACAAPKVCSGDGNCRDPRCVAAGDQGNGAVCDGTTLLACIAGMSTETECPDACVTSDGQTFCALSTAADPKCAGTDSYCDGATVVDCSHGFATSRFPCPGAQTCLLNPTRCD